MFSEGWGSREGLQIGTKNAFRPPMGHFWVPLECYYFKVGFKGAFLEKDGDQAERFWGPGAHQGTLAKAKVPS